jgi:hypothetical protein
MPPWPGLISFLAIMIEAIAFMGPKIIVTATTNPTSAVGHASKVRWWQRRLKVVSKADTEAPAATAAVRSTAALPVKTKNPSKSKPAAVGEADSVRQWKECRTIERAGSEIKPKETYEGSYLPWCQEQGIEPVSFTRFGGIMKGELGVQYIDRNKRGFYTGIALVSAPRLVVAAG